MPLVEHIIEVMFVNGVSVADHLRLDGDQSLHVVGDVTGEAGSVEPEQDLGHDWIELDDVEHRLLNEFVVTLSLWDKRIV